MNEKWFENMDEMGQEAFDNSSTLMKEAAWQKMESLLGGDKKKKRFAFWWWSLPALLLMFGAGFWLANALNKNNKQTEFIKQNVIEKPLTENETKPSKKLLSNKTNENIVPQKKDVGATTNSETATENNSIRKIITVKRNIFSTINNIKNEDDLNGGENVMGFNTLKLSKNKKVAKLSSEILMNDGDNVLIDKSKLSTEKDTGEKSVIKDNSINFISEKLAHQIPSLDITKSPENSDKDMAVKLDIANDNAQKINPAAPLEKTIAKTLKPNAGKRSKFSFGLLGATDITTINFKKFDKISTAYGLGVSYKLGKRWAIGTGINFARKLYLADSLDYHNIYTPSWSYKVLKIDANCKVIDIPINVSYLINNGKQFNWYATAGLSSYFMKNESYDYTILSYGAIKNVNYSYQNKNNHKFSILNLGFDFEKNIGNGFAWRLSPYLKLPLTGIGAGTVNLESAGLQFSLQFSPKAK